MLVSACVSVAECKSMLNFGQFLGFCGCNLLKYITVLSKSCWLEVSSLRFVAQQFQEVIGGLSHLTSFIQLHFHVAFQYLYDMILKLQIMTNQFQCFAYLKLLQSCLLMLFGLSKLSYDFLSTCLELESWFPVRLTILLPFMFCTSYI